MQHSCHPYLIEAERDAPLVARVQGDSAVYMNCRDSIEFTIENEK